MKDKYNLLKEVLKDSQVLVKPNLYSEWINFLLKDNDKVKDASLTYSCLVALKEENLSYDELQTYLKRMYPSKSNIDITYPIIKASKYSIYGKELHDECTEKFGTIINKEDLEDILNCKKPNRKRK